MWVAYYLQFDVPIEYDVMNLHPVLQYLVRYSYLDHHMMQVTAWNKLMTNGVSVRHIVFDRHIELQIVSNLHERWWVIHIYELRELVSMNFFSESVVTIMQVTTNLLVLRWKIWLPTDFVLWSRSKPITLVSKANRHLHYQWRHHLHLFVPTSFILTLIDRSCPSRSIGPLYVNIWPLCHKSDTWHKPPPTNNRQWPRYPSSRLKQLQTQSNINNSKLHDIYDTW